MPFLQQSLGEAAVESKKPRRSQRILSQSQDFDAEIKQAQLPSPLTHKDTTATEEFEDGTITPPSQRPSQFARPANVRSPLALGLSSPPSDTQPFSQFVYPPQALSYEVQDEEGEGVWGYLVPLDSKSGDTLVLRKRSACPAPLGKNGKITGRERVDRRTYERQEEEYENRKVESVTAGGYLIGRHPECGTFFYCSPRRSRISHAHYSFRPGCGQPYRIEPTLPYFL